MVICGSIARSTRIEQGQIFEICRNSKSDHKSTNSRNCCETVIINNRGHDSNNFVIRFWISFEHKIHSHSKLIIIRFWHQMVCEMHSTKLLILIICLISEISISFTALGQLNSKCGYPGKPYRAKLEPDNKLQYEEGEEVNYQCTDFWIFVHSRRCEKGKWTGPQPRCGKSILMVAFIDELQISFVLLGVPLIREQRQ